MPPKVIGPYRVLETLGSGGAGTVYRALDRRTGEPAALKLLSAGPALDPRAARRLAREFETLADLSHPNVVKVFDAGVFQGYPYLAMELVEGLTLKNYLSLGADELGSAHPMTAAVEHRQRLAASDDVSASSVSSEFSMSNWAEETPTEETSTFGRGPASLRAFADAMDEPDTVGSMEFELPYDVDRLERAPAMPRRAVNFGELNHPTRISRLKDAMMQLCEALSYIHGHGLVHRDLKPTNVMVDDDRLVRLMDFGLARFLADDASVTADGKLVGTFRYMSPEQIRGENIDARADLYSLGIILYELLSGQVPFDADAPQELWRKVLETEPIPLTTLNSSGDRQLSRIAHRLIRKEPDDRYQTAEEVYEALAE